MNTDLKKVFNYHSIELYICSIFESNSLGTFPFLPKDLNETQKLKIFVFPIY